MSRTVRWSESAAHAAGNLASAVVKLIRGELTLNELRVVLDRYDRAIEEMAVRASRERGR